MELGAVSSLQEELFRTNCTVVNQRLADNILVVITGGNYQTHTTDTIDHQHQTPTSPATVTTVNGVTIE